MQRALQLLVSAVVLLWSTAAGAQVTLDQFTPAPVQSDGFAVSRPSHPGHLRPGFQLLIDYAKDPLILEMWVNGKQQADSVIVKHQLVAHAVASYALYDRVLLFAHVPVSLLMNGTQLTSSLGPDGAALGNVGLGGRLHLLGEADDLFALGAQITVALPTARWASEDNMFAGERSATGHFQLLGELRKGRFRVTPNVGTRVLSSDVRGLHVDNMLTYGIGAAYGALRENGNELNLVAEVFGTSPFSHFGARSSSPMEFLVGPKMTHKSGLAAGLAGGAGITHGYGAPAYRVIASVGWEKPLPRDRDHDGILDTSDACPDEPEDRDDFQDADGCPERDNDRDGLLDVRDMCPIEPEDHDGIQDLDGCPEVDPKLDGDTDADGILDSADHCPLKPEDTDAFQDTDGCPDPDNDGDGFLDADDTCPLEAETVNGKDDQDGCPDKIRVDRSLGQILILEPVQFAFNSSRILPESFEMLNEIVDVMKAHPEITMLSIEGHTDARGSALRNQILSEERAQSVREYLIQGGIALERLDAQGYGPSRPIADNKTIEGRAKNRRVEFKM